MFTVNFIGTKNKKDKDYVKITMILYKTGYARVPKVLDITGLFKLWDTETHRFDETTSDGAKRNKELSDLKAAYLSIAEDWEKQNIEWCPVQWSHCFEEENPEEKEKVKIMTVDKCMDVIIEDMRKRKRFKNGRIITSMTNANLYRQLRNTLRDFTKEVYNKSFSTYYFKDINEEFIKDYVLYLRERGAKKGNKGGVNTRLKKLKGVFWYANKKGQPYTDPEIFESVQPYMQKEDAKPQTIAYEYITKIEQLDKTQFSEKEQFHIDVFLFSFYAGGMAPIDVCYLTWSSISISDNIIDYERIKFPKSGVTPFNDGVKEIIEKHRNKCYSNFVLPILSHKHKTEVQQRGRIKRFQYELNKTLKRVAKLIDCNKDFTWYAARGTFITKMLDEDFHPIAVAKFAGNSPNTIYKHYWDQTDPDNILSKMNQVLHKESL